MILDIKPIRTPALNMREDIVASILSWLKFDYELILTEAWGFDFLPEDPKFPGMLGNRIYLDRGDLSKSLNKYYGIKIEQKEQMSKVDYLNIIKEELQNQKPVLAHIQTSILPYHRTYNKPEESHLHQILINGIEEDNIYWIDPPWTEKVNNLNKDIFLEQVEIIETFDFKNIKFEYDAYEVLHFLTHRLRIKKSECNNIYDAIKRFADSIEKDFNISIEVKGTDYNIESLRFNSFFFNIELISRLRNTIAEVIIYIGKNKNIENLNTIADEFKLISQEWMRIRYMILKKAMNPSDSNILNKAKIKLYQLADKEEQMEKKLLKIEEEDFKNVIKENKINNLTEIEFIELSPYFNNHGIKNTSLPDCSAKLNMSFLSYIIKEDFPVKQFWEIDKMKFNYSPVVDCKNDNLFCTGQIISIPNGNYVSIMILGFSLLRAFAGTLNTFIDNNLIEEVDFAITDIGSPFPRYDEKIAWKGKFFEKTEIKKGNIYCKEFFLKNNSNINKIQLPEWPMLSILAISLRKNDIK